MLGGCYLLAKHEHGRGERVAEKLKGSEAASDAEEDDAPLLKKE